MKISLYLKVFTYWKKKYINKKKKYETTNRREYLILLHDTRLEFQKKQIKIMSFINAKIREWKKSKGLMTIKWAFKISWSFDNQSKIISFIFKKERI